MGRLCERPGCSESAAVAYGMRAEDLVFWLDVIRPSEEITGGVLCRRHADSMVVPRNWTLDDLRDPDLHLFRPPTASATPAARSRRTSGRDSTVEQLRLGVAGAGDEVTAGTIDDERVADVEIATHDSATDDESSASDASIESDDEPATPWSPAFDVGDDLDGLLAARSPLLSRAFRGDDRQR